MRRRRQGYRIKKHQRQLFWLGTLLLVWVFCSGLASAGASAGSLGELSDRISRFPDWTRKPATVVPVQTSDLEYPDWMAGTWAVESMLVDLYAPLAPDIITPGFEGNRDYVDQPLSFQVRFGPAQPPAPTAPGSPFPISRKGGLVRPQLGTAGKTGPIVADRAFNGLNIARAYLGDGVVYKVTVDPANPNRQVTDLQGQMQLVSTVTGRATETPDPDQFIATEIVQQIFRGVPQPYLNEVESTTVYRHLPEGTATGQEPDAPVIEADQFTAIYLSPKDPDYFRAKDRPVALYRYRLAFRS